MRPVAEFDSEHRANTFSDYLLANGIENHVDTENGGPWTVWVLEEDQLAAARTLLDKFLNSETPDSLRQASRAAARIREEQKARQAGFAKKVKSRPETLQLLRRQPVGALTLALVLVSVVVSLLTGFGRNDPLGLLPALMFSTQPSGAPEIMAGQLWRLISPVFLHFSLLHLLFNMFWLFELGSALEYTLGRPRFGSLFLVTAAVSNSAQYLVGPHYFGGMSGVVYALAAFTWVKQAIDPASPVRLNPGSALVLAIWFVLCWTPVVPGVANITHLGGLLAGAACALVFRWPEAR